MKNKKNIAIWVVQVLLLIAFLGAGGMKLTGPAEMVENFARWGFPAFFLYVVGAIEVLGGLTMLHKKSAPLGALLLGGTMLGAIGTHVIHAEYPAIVPPLVLGLLASVVLWGRLDQLKALFGQSPSAATV